MKQVEMVILANSIKHGEHCVAGKDINTKEWFRPVSDESGGALSLKQVMCTNPYGQYPAKPMQKIIMTLGQHVPKMNQPENFQVNDSNWVQHYKLAENELENYLDLPNDLWGRNDRVSFNKIHTGNIIIQNSLYLVKVEDLKLFVSNNGKRRCSFSYNGIQYELAATDPMFDSLLKTNVILKGILCVSLGEEYLGYCYKLVASIY
ncbi:MULTISPECIES: hypothetical protein [Pseudoalteromonas]|uniref:Dual OB-containing domain-containing protein n=1 Tax=Pseudoalteromonas arctica TaxID=394751 RepID=A0ABU9TKX5_9GAMM|nr:MULTISPECIES: hypothetical protein [unclassified Pseudoalteromonas]MBH0031976.1 hypothetical protein [Pseudoalteromonas sp. SWYJZ98]